MSISDVAIRNPVFSWMMMFALMIFGFISYSRMGVSQLPDIDFPVVTISLTWSGAAPEVMETDVVDVIENAVMSTQGMQEVTSIINQGAATVTIQFDLSRNIDAAVQDVQTKIAQVQRLLPRDMDPPTIIKVNPEDQPVMWIAVTGAQSLRDLIFYVYDYLQDQFSGITGVGDMVLGGYVEPNLRIWVDDKKLRAAQLTASDIITAVQQQHQEVPAGIIQTPVTQQNVRVMGEAPTPEAFGNIIIPRRAGGPVYRQIRLRDVATIEDGLNDVLLMAHAEGKTAVGLGLRKQPGANELTIAQGALKRLEQVRPTIPKGINASVSFNRTTYIRDSINELLFTLVLSAIITSLVCWLFLGTWGATVNVLLAIPTSILGTFLVIYFLGFTLNTFTVLGLSLAVGIVVDDAIMVLENIVRYQENGASRLAAARDGARQITFAAFAATLALIAIFLPVAFISGIIGRLFFQYAVTISVAVALSLLEALTLTPMRSAEILNVHQKRSWLSAKVNDLFHATARRYTSVLHWSLDHRWLVLILATIFFICSLLFVGVLRKEFTPAQDQSSFAIRLQTPPISSIDYTNEKFKEVERAIMSRPEVSHYFSVIGGFFGGQSNQGFIFVTLKNKRERPVTAPFKRRPTQQELMAYFRKELNRIPDVKAIIQDFSQASFSARRGFPIELSVQGPNWQDLAVYSERLRTAMAKTGLMTDVDTDYIQPVPEVRVYPDRQKAAARGVDVATIGNTVNALIGGEPIDKYTAHGKRYDVRIRLVASQRAQAGDIDRLQVWNNRGELVNLRDVVTIRQEPASLTVTRRNRERAISLYANVAAGKSQTAAMAEVQRLATQLLPPPYHIAFSGASQTFTESFSSLVLVLGLGILVSYMVLGSQFNSYLHPLYILLALPFSISGAFISLWVGGQSLNIYSFIGLILLMGIVKKNSILLVDFTNHYRNQGMSIDEALRAACPVRLRPILMTSVATIAAALPAALALGPGAETRMPMAIAVIGGVIFSTLLTLLVVPSAYSAFSWLERGRHRGMPEEEEPKTEPPSTPSTRV